MAHRYANAVERVWKSMKIPRNERAHEVELMPTNLILQDVSTICDFVACGGAIDVGNHVSGFDW